MKILSLNLHGFEEKNILLKQKLIVDTIIKEDIDIVFLQEVAQSIHSDILFNDIKEDNYGYRLTKILQETGHTYYYHYKTGNIAFNKYDEGLAILSKTKLFDIKDFFISKTNSYDSWNTRVIVSAKTIINNKVFTLASIHFGWTDGFEVFEDQVDSLLDNLNNEDTNIIAGDFNVEAGSNEYNYIVNKGYIDLFYNGETKFFKVPTHLENMDIHTVSSRIDYVMSNKKSEILNRKILFNEKRVSDHFGVFVELDY